MTNNSDRVRINVSRFGKYDAFFIFHDTVFPTYPENHDTKEGFCFLFRGTKTKFFLLLRLKKISIEAYLIFIKTVMLVLSWHKILFPSVNWSQFFEIHFSYVLFLYVHWYAEDCFTITERCFKPVYY